MLEPSATDTSFTAEEIGRAPTEVLWPAREANPEARAELVRRYLPLARKLALRYRSSREPFDDLVQVANLGLFNAVSRYDHTVGVSFVGFATPTILGELKRHFRDTGWSVHVPRGAQELALKVQRASETLTERLGRSPQILELAGFLKVSEEEVLTGLESAQAHYAASLEEPLGGADPDAATLGETFGSVDDGYELVETTSLLRTSLRELPYLERRALTLRIEHDLKQSEIGARLGCSQMQVSRLLRRAAARLRADLDETAA